MQFTNTHLYCLLLGELPSQHWNLPTAPPTSALSPSAIPSINSSGPWMAPYEKKGYTHKELWIVCLIYVLIVHFYWDLYVTKRKTGWHWVITVWKHPQKLLWKTDNLRIIMNSMKFAYVKEKQNIYFKVWTVINGLLIVKLSRHLCPFYSHLSFPGIVTWNFQF